MLKEHPHSIKLLWFAVSWLQALVIDTSYNHGVKVGGDGHTSSLVIYPPGILLILVSSPIPVSIQERAQRDMNGAGVCP